MNIRKLEIGGGTDADPLATNLDPVHGQYFYKRRAQDGPWPTDDETYHEIKASHVMEHIPAGPDRLHVFNEAWRVLKPGGTFEVIVPLLGEGWSPAYAVADPTHVSFWVLESFMYFDGRISANADYGIKPWHTLELWARNKWEGHWKGTPRKGLIPEGLEPKSYGVDPEGTGRGPIPETSP